MPSDPFDVGGPIQIPGFYKDVADIAHANTSTSLEYDLLYDRLCAICIRIAAHTKYSTLDVANAYRRLETSKYNFLQATDADILSSISFHDRSETTFEAWDNLRESVENLKRVCISILRNKLTPFLRR